MQKTAFILSITVLLTTAAFAQQFDNTFSHLQKSDVEQFIRHFAQIKTEFEKSDIDYNVADGDFESVFDALNTSAEAEHIVKKYDYSDLYNFTVELWAITISYINIKIDTEGYPAFDNAVNEIDNDPSLTAEQKQFAKTQVEQLINALKANFEQMANPGDIEVVKPFIPQLDLLFKEEE